MRGNAPAAQMTMPVASRAGAPAFPNLRHLFAFQEVAKTQSVSLAAQNVHLSQPAITQAVLNLEKLMEVKLFKRGNNGMFMTSAGEVFRARVDRALSQIQQGLSDLSSGRAAAGLRRDVKLERLITTAQLKALVAVVNNGNFAMAARALAVSQPTIHRAARDLERLLAVPLYEKTSYGVQATREARKLSMCAKLAFAEFRQAWAEIKALEGIHAGMTVIGTMPLARTYLVPKAIATFTGAYPDESIEILEGTYEHLLEGLRTGDIDLLIGALRPTLPVEDVEQRHLFDDPLSIVVRAGHPLAGAKALTGDLMRRYPWIAPRQETPLRKHFDRLFLDAGVTPPSRLVECNSLVAARAILNESDHMMLLSSHQIRYEKAAGMLVELPLPGEAVSRPIGITTRRDWHPTGAQLSFIELLSDEASRL